MDGNRVGRCVWCQGEDLRLTKDHVFPDAIGGTLELAVPVCSVCQAKLSKAERELARRSDLGLWRHTRDFKVPSSRLRRDPTSGSIEAKYGLRKDADGLYKEVAFREGRGIALPCIQIEVARLGSNDMRIRVDGTSREDRNRLIECMTAAVGGPPDAEGYVGSVDVALLDEYDAEIVSDPDFLPRVFLDLRGRPIIRARTGEEAKRFAAIFMYIVGQAAFRDQNAWTSSEVTAGTPHTARLEWDESMVLRVIAKIAYGVAYIGADAMIRDRDSWPRLRRYVLGELADSGYAPVTKITEAGGMTEYADYHLAAIDVLPKGLRGLVSLYGACYVVEFDAGSERGWEPIVAVCKRSGGETRYISGDAAVDILQLLRHAEQGGSTVHTMQPASKVTEPAASKPRQWHKYVFCIVLGLSALSSVSDAVGRYSIARPDIWLVASLLRLATGLAASAFIMYVIWLLVKQLSRLRILTRR